MKLSNINIFNEIPVMLSMPEVKNEYENRFMGAIFFDDVVITRHPELIKIWDIKNLPDIKLINSIEIEWSGEHIKKYGDLLYVGQDKYIAIYDLSNLKEPIKVGKVLLPEYHYFIAAENGIYAMIERSIYLIDEKGNSNKIIDLPQDNEMMFDYPIDICKFKNSLYLSFRHCGLYLYEQSEMSGSYEFVSKHCPATGYTPTDMQWLEEGKELLLIGNDSVVQYNVSNSKKLKRYKAAKTKATATYGNFTELDNELLVVGIVGAKNKFVVNILTPTDKGVIVINTPKINYKMRDERAHGTIGEEACGVTLQNRYLLIVGKESGFFLFEAE